MLTIWSGKSTTINRKNQDPLRIKNPCITIAGGVQIKKLPELAKAGRADNGIIPRCGFIWPDQCSKSYYSSRKLSDDYVQGYRKYILQLLTIPEDNNVELSVGAEALYKEFYNANADKANAEPIDFIKEMYAKLDIMVLRIALIVHAMKMVLDGGSVDQVEPETMEFAIRITEYFRATGLKAYEQISENSKPDISRKDVILALRDLFNITNQSAMAKFLNVSQQYINRIFKGD
jgi:hypothetical protein